jgi:hypothetical protein
MIFCCIEKSGNNCRCLNYSESPPAIPLNAHITRGTDKPRAKYNILSIYYRENDVLLLQNIR